jgi:cell volume regulation protein A
MDSSSEALARQVLETLFAIFALGTLGGKVAQRLRIPDVVVYVILGMLMGPAVLGWIRMDPQSVVYQVILIMGASAILYHGGMVTDLQELRKLWLSITLLPTLGLVVTALVTAIAVQLVFHLPMLQSMLLGAILASTDPAALVPIFQRLPIRPRLAHTVISESAFTDATGAILTTVVMGLLAPSPHVHAGSVVLDFLRLTLGGLLVGGVVGWVTAFLISENDRGLLREFTPMVTVLSVLASYLGAEWIGSSGFMSVFVAGLMVGNARSIKLTILPREERAAHEFMDAVGLKFRMLIFILLGSQVDFGALQKYGVGAVIIAGVFMFVARPLTVLASLLPDRAARWEQREILFLFWTRETGVIAAALTGIAASAYPAQAGLLSSVVFVIILATLLLQASTTPLVARRLGLLEER